MDTPETSLSIACRAFGVGENIPYALLVSKHSFCFGATAGCQVYN